mmetsp:Transcript_4918/g.9208  ORF Transcript_4918/g.9208 Transcript_4918/m.9208 type:complete len:288 (-) Transcript_4918:737-1600(-)
MAWTFSPSPLQYSAMYLIVGLAFIGIGLFLYDEAHEVVEVYKRYDDLCDLNWENPKECEVTVDIHEDLDSPVFLYYELTDFYQNHRSYAKSRDARQLMGDDREKYEIREYCSPIVTMEDLELITNLNLDDDDPANPCGLIARSLFNDTFSLYYPKSGKEVEIDQDSITWGVEREEMYDRADDWKEDQWTDVENEHFMVWMSVAGLPTFRKLWGRIDDDLDEGYYKLVILNQYDVDDFDGEKHIVLSTVGAFGGKITFMAIVYLTIGAVAVLCSGLMLLAYFLKRTFN